MPIYVDVITKLDERAAKTAADRIEKEFTQAGKRAGDQFSNSMNASMSGIDRTTRQLGSQLTSGFSDHGRRAGQGFGRSFGSELASSLPGVGRFTSAMAGYEGAAAKAGAVAGRALGLAFTTAAAGLIGAAGFTLFKGFERYKTIDAANNRLKNLNRTLEQTGRATIDVEAVMGTVNEVVEGTRFSLQDAFSVSTKALQSPTGDLKRFMTVVADAAEFAGASVSDVGNAFVKIANQGKVSMGELTNELIDLPIQQWLSETMGKSTAEITKMISESKIGLEELMKAVEFGASGLAKGGVNSLQGALEQMGTAVSRLGANVLGAVFGEATDDANGLTEAVNAFAGRINDVNTWVNQHRDDIKRFFDQAVDAVGDLISAIRDVLGWLDKIGIGVDDVVKAFVAWKSIKGVATLVDNLAGISTTLSDTLPASADKGAKGISDALSRVVVPAWLLYLAGDKALDAREGATWGNGEPVSRMPSPSDFDPRKRSWSEILYGPFAGTWLDKLLGKQPPQAPAPPPMPDMPAEPAHNFYKDWYPATHGPGPAGSPILPPSGADGGSGGSGPKLPEAPVVPFAGDPMSLLQGFPVTSSLYSAASSAVDAQHNLAEKRARLAQLEQSNEATEQDVLKARNDVIEAEQNLQQAELRLNEAKQSATEKHTKTLDGLTTDLGEIGASLDKDFGISKGLAGIAENITKFLANLAFAPVAGALSAVSQAGGGDAAGSGLAGVIGSAMGFGPAFEQQAMYAASPMGPAAWNPMAFSPTILKDTGSVPSGPQSRAAAALVERYFGSQLRGTIGGSRDTNTAKGTHDAGLSIDIPIGPDQMALGDQINAFLQANAGPLGLKYTIWRNQGRYPGGGGFTAGGHMDHIDAHFDPSKGQGIWSSMPSPLPVTVQQWSADWNAIAQKESGGNWHINTGNGFFGGLQFQPSSWAAAGGTQFAPRADLATPFQQALTAENLLAMQGPGAWPNTFVPGSSGPAPMAGGAMPGMGMPQSAPFNFASGVGAGPTPGPTVIGGGPGLSGSGQGGVGIEQGGLADTAIQMGLSAAGLGLDAMAPGAGQVAAAAANAGIKLGNRAIKFAGEVAGIGAQGLLDTFLPFGGSQLASNNWLTRIVGGLAGAAPQIPNIAGKAAGQLSKEQVAQQQQQGQQPQGQQPGINVEYNNYQATEDRAGADLTHHLGNMYAAPGVG